MQKRDFTADKHLVFTSGMAIVVGALCSIVALVLQWLIYFFTNLFFYQRLSLAEIGPAGHTLGPFVVLVPAVGGLAIGLLARYGSERIRGHGIPEAIEAILIGQSRMSPRVALLKPLSSAISIGSGGPFGAEGPIIMTGGACGSIFAQLFHLTAAERKTLLVAGAAGGMSATFSTPVAAVLLAVELLLFEWKPRSLIPVALSSTVAALFHTYVLGGEPILFPAPPHGILPAAALFSSAALGLLCGVLALVLTLAVYGAEDLFHRLPIHWMWWPAIGGLIVGIGGYFEPRALGVGYDLIRELLEGKLLPAALAVLVAVKAIIWAGSLGSGTSGGVLAPLLIMGGSVGAIAAGFLPGGDAPLWSLVAMAAVLGGTMRSPLTGAVFALELTHDINALPALLLGAVVAHGFTVLVMKRSILTEKIARRGYHVSREYSVDPLELVSVGEAMSRQVAVIPAELPLDEILSQFFLAPGARKHQGYPVVDRAGRLHGVLTRSNLLGEWLAEALAGKASNGPGPIIAFDLLDRRPVTAYPWETCRTAAERMAQNGVGRLPVVDPEQPSHVIGIVTRSDILKARASHLEGELRRERFLAVGQGNSNGDAAAKPTESPTD